MSVQPESRQDSVTLALCVLRLWDLNLSCTELGRRQQRDAEPRYEDSSGWCVVTGAFLQRSASCAVTLDSRWPLRRRLRGGEQWKNLLWSQTSVPNVSISDSSLPTPQPSHASARVTSHAPLRPQTKERVLSLTLITSQETVLYFSALFFTLVNAYYY